jgi:hypothetical protein
VIDHLTKLAPLEPLGEPSDIAAAVSFLGPTEVGSTARCCATMAGSSDLASAPGISLQDMGDIGGEIPWKQLF